jgi:DNA polymerase III psi subunit
MNRELKRQGDYIYYNMLMSNPDTISTIVTRILTDMNKEKIYNQILALTSALICMLDKYGLDHVDVLSITDAIVNSGENNNTSEQFQHIKDNVIKKYMEN